MSRRARIGTAAGITTMVVAGILCAALFTDASGQLVGYSLIGVGLIAATAVAFLEVGLSEDRERERERGAASGAGQRTPTSGEGKRDGGPPSVGRAGAVRRPRRPLLGRSRGHRRRLG